ncbi:MAG TPA: S1C family serine protease, partial [Acidimicrobiales bacterium]|nr:S1C family serine protease [Acidimicrobiales bacterium]
MGKGQLVAGTLVGVAVLVVIGVIAATVVRPGPSQPGGTGSSGTATTLAARLPASALKVQSSLVALVVVTPSGHLHGCAVVVSGNGLIATTVDVVKGAQSILAVTADGTREPATLVAMDSASDVAVLRMPDDLPVAQFVDDGQLTTSTPAFVMGLSDRVGGATHDAMQWTGARIGWVGEGVVGGPAEGMSGIEAWLGTFPSIPGEALVDTSGQVAGILDPSAKAATASAVFLP